MKVEIISSEYSKNLEEGINEFIEGKKVIDIKFAINDDSLYKYALIMYENNRNDCNEDEKLKAEYTRGYMDERSKWKDKVNNEIKIHRDIISKWATVKDDIANIAILKEKYIIQILENLIKEE